MESEIIKNRLGISFEIYRGPGNGISFSGDYPIDLPDEGARISFTEFNPKRYGSKGKVSIQISFGYTSPSGKDYSRSLSINLTQARELSNF